MPEFMTLTDALDALDVNNDEHWTAGGAPKLKVLKELTGNDNLTVSDVVDCLPVGFNRANAAAAPSPVEPSEDGDEVMPHPLSDAAVSVANLIEGSFSTGDFDPVVLMEAVVAAAQTDRYRRNNALQNLVRGFLVSQVEIRDMQARLDLRWNAKIDASQLAKEQAEQE